VPFSEREIYEVIMVKLLWHCAREENEGEKERERERKKEREREREGGREREREREGERAGDEDTYVRIALIPID
jgi:hypothetical protein